MGKEERDEHVADLEAEVQQQAGQIEQLEAYSQELLRQHEATEARSGQLDQLLEEVEESSKARRADAEQEINELRSLVEAQEAALHDQRRIIQDQGGLIDALSAQIQAGAGCKGLVELEPPVGASPPEGVRPAPQPRPSPAPGAPRSMGPATASAGPAMGLRRQPGGAPGGVPGTRAAPGVQTSKTPREQLFSQKRPGRASTGPAGPECGPYTSPRAEPPAPRPNSAFGSTAQRSRSWAADRSPRAGSPTAGRGRGPSPGATTVAATPRKPSGGATLPPALPLLRASEQRSGRVGGPMR